MKVRWSAGALIQFKSAHAYLMRENPPAAHSFLDSVERIIGLLRNFPR